MSLYESTMKKIAAAQTEGALKRLSADINKLERIATTEQLANLAAALTSAHGRVGLTFSNENAAQLAAAMDDIEDLINKYS